MEKKKIILIAVISIILIVSIVGVTIFLVNKNNSVESNDLKTAKLYDDLKSKSAYSFTITLDENNKMYYAKNNDTAYIDTLYESDESKFIVRDGNSYLLNDSDKVYYTYKNNETDLKKIEQQLESIKDLECVQGTEKIENKQYKYEEYAVETDFLFKFFEDSDMKNVKTRFYYDGDRLAYIKTIVGDYQELLKVDISYKVDNKLFEIPSDYEEA